MSATPRTVGAIDWGRWAPVHHATLLFVVRDGRVLLIRKKRGLGAGKINGPGGKIDPGEAPAEAAVREVQEEVGVLPTGILPMGELSFQFIDGYSIHVHVFRASGCEGQPRETDEATPFWVTLEQVPYSEMWADDVLWLPAVLEGRSVTGRFVFDEDRMLDHSLTINPESPELDRG